ncbi:ganglioside-induced differentiation-associated protein 1-like 1 isoform X1 [Peromyscus eremicus]|uniref:ganglioside-induced differentiation-associated protein 1-like 1 isoform X1 n=3 Tax=Cricetidae TaxID=337677 RepID=UPI0027DDF25E|nr:ganglioside-induced differentiation-associated protein 1-like 1 isoform X1 [Peromyscus eremicus]
MLGASEPPPAASFLLRSRAVMATPNNLTPTNCSWWPISALESDAAKPVEAPDAPEASSPAHWPKESLVLYHWTQSFSSQKRLQVRLVIAEKGLACEERDVSLPQSEHKEPWFMRLNLGEEVPVIIHRDNIISDYDQIIDYVERTFTGEHVVALMPEAGSPQHARVLQYRELLDALPMDAYTHGCILHPELTTDSMIPKYATAEIRRHLANATTDLMKLDHEEEPQLSEPYLSKQKKLMAKILEHDDVSYLKKILGELAMVLDQIEAELEKRKLENEGQKCELWLCGCAFTLADVLLGATLHRLKFLGLSKKYWEDGSRPNLQSFFERVQRRFAFRKVLGDIHTTLLSAVIPNAFRLVKRKPPSFFGASFLMGSLGGMGYFAYWYLKKKYI